MKLYELTDQFKQLESEDIDQDVLNDTLEAMEGEIMEKGRSVAAYFQNLDADVTAMKEAEKRIANRRKALEKRSEWLKDYLRENMARCDITKIECPEFSITLGKASKIVRVESESLIPKEFIKTKVTEIVDKIAIKKAIESGEAVEGAALVEGKARLLIK